MTGRVVLFGATGFTGRLTARALVDRGERPLLAGRTATALHELADELGGLPVSVADATNEDAVSALLESEDVLITTVGPFARYGHAAVRAAVGAGVHYLDSTGEPAFVREVFETYGPEAAAAGCGLLTAFGYDYVPGILAGALALREAGPAAVRVDVGYFLRGPGAMSGGTAASGAGIVLAPSYAWRGGRLRRERTAARSRTMHLRGRDKPAVSWGGSEHLALPRFAPGLRDVNVYLGWTGPLTRPAVVGSAVLAAAVRLPGVRPALGALAGRLLPGSTGGPDAAARARVRTQAVAEAYDSAGRRLARVLLEGPNPYDLTGALLAWGAVRARDGGLRGSGALGPVDGFGLAELERGCAEVGLESVADEG